MRLPIVERLREHPQVEPADELLDEAAATIEELYEALDECRAAKGEGEVKDSTLIAAAPELYESLGAAMHDLDPTLSSYQDAAAALAKARGEHE